MEYEQRFCNTKISLKKMNYETQIVDIPNRVCDKMEGFGEDKNLNVVDFHVP